MKEPKVNDDVLKPGCALPRKINHDKTHWPNPVKDSGVSCQLCRWATGKKFIAQIQTCIMFCVNLCVKNISPFHTLPRKLNHDKKQWPNPVKGSGVSCQLCRWATGKFSLQRFKLALFFV